ncbi:hypothetical protein [Psychrobacter sp. 16-MNA-CIBAN-0192]|uniref:hypothetical protein n=1 Tax=Psychrobacter sp. 16-MNA-CIBAN-0192 TaxID=3140448 RepID=UPI00331A45A2
MQQDMAIATVKYFAISGSGAIAAAASLGAQLNTPHVYLNLHLPYWFFLLSMVLLNFIGAFFALKIDYMQVSGSATSNFFTAVTVGLIISFIFIPTISPTSGVGLMQIASFVSGLCGTIFLRVVINILNRQDLQEAIVDLIVSNSIKLANIVIGLAVDHTAKLITALLTTLFASFVLLPTLNDRLNDNSVPPAPPSQVTEVAND